MNCAKCHLPLPADAAFCPNCGTRPGDPVPKAAESGVKTFSGLGTVAPMRESRASVLEPGSRFADRYEVVRKLGEGGMGVVYVARDTNTNEEIVLKLIHPELVTGDEAIKRLMAEGLTARQIRHPNIVAVFDVAQWEGQPYFTMEFVKGGTLRSWMVNHISSGQDVRLETAVGVIKTMLAGLGEAHRMGVVHRDLKPENVLLVGDPDAGDFNLKILDFGIAKAIDAPTTGGSGGAIGTPLYMAPEQMTSADAVGPAADLYSLSVIFYELLMEASPQARWEPVSKNRADVPPSFDVLIEKGLSARPRSRYGSVAEYQSALERALTALRPAPRPDPAPNPPVPPTPPLPPQPPPGPGGFQAWSALSKTTRMGILGAAIVVVAVIGSMMNSEPTVEPEPAPIPGPGPAPSPGPVPPQPQPQPQPPVPGPNQPAFNASGAWMNDQGDVFQAVHDGARFEARGTVTGLGPVVFGGTLSVAGGASFSVYSAVNGALLYQGRGTVPDPRHINIEIRDQFGNSDSGQLHINHPRGQ